MSKHTNWFKDWFNSHYYHILYNHRDYSEAEAFISRLFTYLNIAKNSKVLDLACGKGRHSIQINRLDYDVVGMDLSVESIKYANKFSNDTLHFRTGDMRNFTFPFKFNLVVNLFTSFGYFNEELDNQMVIKSIEQNLSNNGLIVLDYLNVVKTVSKLPTEEKIKKEELIFSIKKEVKNGFIEKDISFSHNRENHHYKEFVKVIDLPIFESYFKNAGIEIIELFGDYQLNPFNSKESDRLILIARKKDV